MATVVLALIAQAAPVAGQSDILLQLRSGSPLGDRFRVDSAGGVVAKSFIGIGIIPQTGSGDRMMWHPFKGAFRAGGVDGTAWDESSIGFYTLASGFNTIASGNYSFAAGNNTNAAGIYSFAMGLDSRTGQSFSGAVAMGITANATGTAAIAMGSRATADASHSIALGRGASVDGFAGAIVIADGSTADSILATAINQFNLRAAGGIRLFTNTAKTTGVTMAAGGSSWVVVSDRDRKHDFLSIDGEDLLTRLRGVPVTTWRYRDEEDRSVRHIGPMAQDWHRAFRFSADETTINMSDFDGVNLAAIKALEERTRRIGALEQELASVRATAAEQTRRTASLEKAGLEKDARIEALETRLARLEAALAGSKR